MATLLGEWGFLDNLNDTSGNGRTATFGQVSTTAGYTFVDGPHPGSRGFRFGAFNQTLRYGRTGLEPASLGVSSMGWVKFEGTATNLGVLAKARQTSSTRYGFFAANTAAGPRARWNDDLHFTDTGPSVATGWHHIAVVDGNTRWAFFVDGVQFDGGARAVTGAGHFENYPWCSGNLDPYNTISDSIAGGCVSGLRIFHGELSDAEVVTWMNTPITAGGGLPTQPWTKVMVGNAQASRVYVGTTKVWGT